LIFTRVGTRRELHDGNIANREGPGSGQRTAGKPAEFFYSHRHVALDWVKRLSRYDTIGFRCTSKYIIGLSCTEVDSVAGNGIFFLSIILKCAHKWTFVVFGWSTNINSLQVR